jgi:phospholipase C
MVKRLGSLFLSFSLLIATTSCGTGGGSTSSGNGGNGGGSGGGTAGDGTINSLQHIIYTFQENRSFDHYFGKLNAYRATKGLGSDVDGLDKVTNPSNPGRDGVPINSFKMVSACTEDVSPAWNSSHAQRNHNNPDISSPSTMDGFAQTAGGFSINTAGLDVNGARAMGYYEQDTLPYYYYMATTFATSDRFFSPVMTKSEPNRMYGFAATSVGQIAVPQQSFDVKTIFSLLQDKNVTWKIYTISPNRTTIFNFFKPFSTNNQDKIVTIDQYFTDVKNGTLPSVAFIEAGAGLDEHPLANVQNGAKKMSQIINALINSSSWKSSAFIMGYDEGGGLYDHVAPLETVNPDGVPVQLTLKNQNTFSDNFTRSGFRVPLLVISPFAKKGFVSHTPMDFTAILKFIEKRWSLPTLTARDAAQPDMSEFFDFANPPWVTPPTDIPTQPAPGDPGAAPCYRNRLP